MSKTVWTATWLLTLACSTESTTITNNPEADTGAQESQAGSGGTSGASVGTGGTSDDAGPDAATTGGSAGTAGSGDSSVDVTAGSGGTDNTDASGGTGSTAGATGTGGFGGYPDPCGTIPATVPESRIMNCDNVGECGGLGPTCPDGCSGFDVQQSGSYMLFKPGPHAGNQCSMCASFGENVAMRLPVNSGKCVRVTGAGFAFDPENGCAASDNECTIAKGISPGGVLLGSYVTVFAPSRPSWLLYEIVELVGRDCPLTCP